MSVPKTDSQTLKSLRQSAQLTQRAVAGSLGVSPGNYNEIESGKRNLPAHYIASLAQLFSVTPRDVIVAAGSKRLEKLLGTFENTNTDTQMQSYVRAPSEMDMLPVFGLSAANSYDLIDLAHTSHDHMVRPNFLQNVPNAFGLEIIGDAMAPRYEQGELVLVNPNQAPRAGHDCVVRDTNGFAMVRRYIGSSDTHVTLAQFNPPRTAKIAKSDIDKLYAIAARIDRR